MSDPRNAHPLDVDLVDFVDGNLDEVQSAIVNDHLSTCLSCRIKRQRIVETPPIELTALPDVAIPPFDAIEVEDVEPGDARPGELWLTAADDASMVLITKVRPNNWGVIVAPVVFDVEIADIGTLVLDQTASPIGVPISIYDGMLSSIPNAALRGQVLRTRPDVDLLRLTAGSPGVTRGTPLEGPGDPRHEIRQYISDRIAAVDPVAPEQPDSDSGTTQPARTIEPLDEGTVDVRFRELQRVFFTHEGAEVRPLTIAAAEPVPASWEGVAEIEWFNQRVLLLIIEGGIPDDRGPIIQLCNRLRGSAVAVHPRADSPVADLYPYASLVGAHDINSGGLLTAPILTGVASQVIESYMTAMVDIPTISRAATSRRSPVDPQRVLEREVDIALAAQVAVGNAARIDPKRIGLTSIADLGPPLTEALRRVFSTKVDPVDIAHLANGHPQ